MKESPFGPVQKWGMKMKNRLRLVVAEPSDDIMEPVHEAVMHAIAQCAAAVADGQLTNQQVRQALLRMSEATRVTALILFSDG